MTAMQTKAAAAYLFGDRRCRPTQTQVARALGIKQPAVSRRLSRFADSLSAAQRARYESLMSSPGRKRRLVPMQLNLADNV